MSSSVYRLEDHPLFAWVSPDTPGGNASESARPKRPLGMDTNTFAVSRDLELFVVDRLNSIHCINLRHRESAKSPDYSVRLVSV
jgi:hypothetical protein